MIFSVALLCTIRSTVEAGKRTELNCIKDSNDELATCLNYNIVLLLHSCISE